jgi:hypothetical protein
MTGIDTFSAVAALAGGLIVLLTYACRTLLRMQEKVIYPLLRVRGSDGVVQLAIRFKVDRVNSSTQHRRDAWSQ